MAGIVGGGLGGTESARIRALIQCFTLRVVPLVVPPAYDRSRTISFVRVLSIAVLALVAPVVVSASVAGASASVERGPPPSLADDGPVATGGRRETEVEPPQVSDIAAARDETPCAGLWIYDSAPRAPASRMRSNGLATARDVSAIADAAGNTHLFTYRPATSHGGGLLASMRDPRGSLYAFSYSPLGRLLTDENPAGGGWTLARSDNSIDYVRGWTVTMISAEGRTRSYALDYPDRRTQLATTTGPDGLPSTRRISDEGTITFDEPDGTHSTAVHAPDLRFGRAAQYLQSSTVTLPSGLTSTVTASELPTLSDPNDPLSLTGFTASTTTPAGTTTATYEPALRRWTTSSAQGRQSILTLDARGRPFFARTANLAPTSIQYDAAGRLHEVDTDGALSARYAYDGNSNRTGALRGGVPTLGMVDAQDRLTEWGGLVFTYTPNGELASRLDTGTSALTQYGYDSSGALRTVALPSGDLIEYVLDPAGRRIGKKVNGVLEQAWLYRDGLRPIAELDGMGNVVSTFVYATGLNVPDTMVRGGVTYRILRDHLGSVRLVVDVATGTVAQRMEHDEWGRVLVDSAPGFQPFGYAGGFWDPDTGLVHFGAREYDPEIARWTSKDPIGFGGGDANFYGYVLGDPVNGIDPGGLFFTTVDAYASANPSDFGEILAAIHETGGGRRGMRCEGARGGGVFRIAGVAGSAVQGVRAVVGMYRLARSVARGVRDFWRLWRSSNWTVPLSGLSSTPLLQAATQPFQGGSLTNAGRALTKHPEVVGQDAQTLRQVLPSDAAVNAAAEGAVAGILSSGSGTLRQIPRYGGVLEVVGGSGFGARWSIETGQFIGFINP